MDITQIYNSFAGEWSGRNIDFDHEFDYQCVDLIRQYWYEKFDLTSTGGPANASDYWGGAPPSVLAKFQPIQTDSPQIGDVVVLNINHIGISNGVVSDTTFQQLDQNGGTLHNGDGIGNDAITVHTFNRSDIMGVLRPIGASLGPIYTISAITPKQVIVGSGMHEWNLSLPTFDDVDNNPFTTAGDNHIITAVATLVRPDFAQYIYYLENAGSPIGWNTLDCTDYSPPPPIPVITAPPAAPTPFKASQKYTLLKTLMYFSSSTDAQNTQNGKGTLAEGTYYVYSTSGVCYNLTTDNMKDQQHWINTLDNVVADEPVKAPETPAVVAGVMKPSLVPLGDAKDTSWQVVSYFYPDHRSVTYETTKRIFMQEYSGKRPSVEIPANVRLSSPGTFPKNGVVFYLIEADNDFKHEWFYGISKVDNNGQANLLKVDIKLTDILRNWKDDLVKYMDIKIMRKPKK